MWTYSLPSGPMLRFEIWCDSRIDSPAMSKIVVELPATAPPWLLLNRITLGYFGPPGDDSYSMLAKTSPLAGSTAIPVRPCSPEPGKIPLGR